MEIKQGQEALAVLLQIQQNHMKTLEENLEKQLDEKIQSKIDEIVAAAKAAPPEDE